jgi:hypothetical protein
MFLLFAALLAASNGGDRWSSRVLARCCSSAGSYKPKWHPLQQADANPFLARASQLTQAGPDLPMRPSIAVWRDYSTGASRRRVTPMPRGSRPSTAAFTSVGARNAGEIVGADAAHSIALGIPAARSIAPKAGTFGGRAKTRYLSTSSCAGNRAAVRPPFVFAVFGTVSLSRVLTNSVSFSEKRIGSPLCSAKNCGSNTLNQMPWR